MVSQIFPLVFIVFFLGCNTSPTVSTLSYLERETQNHFFELELIEYFEKKVVLTKEDTMVVRFIQKLLSSLVDSSEELKDLNFSVFLMKESPSSLSSYSLPKSRIYLSIALLKKIENEAQLAGVLAIQIGHLIKRNLFKRLEKLVVEWSKKKNLDLNESFSSTPASFLKFFRILNKDDFFTIQSLFSFSEQSELDAMGYAVQLLYKTGYDPRTMLSLCHLLYKKNDFFDKRVSFLKKRIVTWSPLRNPILKTKEFIQIKKRLEVYETTSF